MGAPIPTRLSELPALTGRVGTGMDRPWVQDISTMVPAWTAHTCIGTISSSSHNKGPPWLPPIATVHLSLSPKVQLQGQQEVSGGSDHTHVPGTKTSRDLGILVLKPGQSWANQDLCSP